MRNTSSILVILAAAGSLSACNDPNTVLFVTNSSLGINFDSKPATANIAYDRVEGFIGPRFENGGAPPAVASIQTDGNIFNPTVRQTYATGSAAVGATTGEAPRDAPDGLEGRSDQKKLMYFGTSTTFGLKVGFAATGNAPVPDSFLFGYRRKEASIIPIAERQAKDKPEGTMTATYPSVLASMEVNVSTAPNDPTGTGTATNQFFATGRAAEALSTNPRVQAAFRIKAENAALAGLTDDQRKEAAARARAAYSASIDRSGKVLAYVTTGGKLDSKKLADLVDAAREKDPDISPDLKKASGLDELKRWLSGDQPTINGLFTAIPKS